MCDLNLELLAFERATIADVETFISLENKVARIGIYFPITERVEAENELGTNEVHFIKYRDQVIGYIEHQMRGSTTAYLGGLVIDPDFQGRGIARHAVEFLLNKLKDVNRIELVAHPHNSKAIRLYLSYDFQIEEWKENYFGDGQPRLVLARARRA